MALRHFLDLSDHSRQTLREILDAAAQLKRDWKGGTRQRQRGLLADKVLVMLFEKPSTRTRVSFDIAMRQLGGGAVSLNAAELQLGRGESVADTARVLSRYGQAIMIRADSHRTLLELAGHGEVPVINGLTDESHPCQILADIMTFEEHRGDIAGQTVAWVGDGSNNVARSWLHAAGVLGFDMAFASPQGYQPDEATLGWAREIGANVKVGTDPAEAVAGARAVVTDAWVSMGDEDVEARYAALRPFQVTGELMRQAAEDAVFMHCLPAHRDEEVTEAVIDGPASVVFDEAENRLHAQKAVLVWCLDKVASI